MLTTHSFHSNDCTWNCWHKESSKMFVYIRRRAVCLLAVSCVQNFYISKWMMDAIIISFIHICCLPVFSMCIILQLHVRLYLKSKEYTWKSMFLCINIYVSLYVETFSFELCPMSLLWCFYVCAATPLDCEYEKTHTRKTWHCPHTYTKNDVETTANINI